MSRKVGAMLLPLFFMFPLACNSESDERNDGAPRGNDSRSTFGLVGLRDAKFATACEKDSGIDSTFREWVEFQSNSFTFVWARFDGPNCDEARRRVTYREPNRNASAKATADLEGWTTYDFVADGTRVIVHQEVVARAFSQRRQFGMEQWAVGREVDVSGLSYDTSSEPKRAKGESRKSTIKVDGDTLYVARYADGSIQVDRPFVYQRMN